MAKTAESMPEQGRALPRKRGVAGWLSNVPIADPVDRRNAPMLQIVLLLIGIPTPLIWLYRAVLVDIPWRPGEVQGMLLSLATSAVALFSVWLIRRGHFQWAIRQVLILIALSTIYAYSAQGAGPQTFEEPLLVVWIVLSGLMIGRGALWLMFAAIVLALIGGGIHAVNAAGTDGPPFTEIMILLTKAIIFLLIAVVIDRSVMALRETLAESSRRSDALSLSNTRLETEIAERRRTEEKLIHAQKVEAVGRLASGIAHDFNHLLTLISGYAAKGRQAESDGERIQALEGIDAATQRGIATTSRLLDFSRYDTARIERFDPVTALHDLKPLLRQMLAPHVRLAFDLPDAANMVLFDRVQLDLALLNIAANAKSAMPDGGEFSVALRDSDDGGSVEIELRDTGHGMSPEVVSRLFEPFFTTRPPGQGVGLGLSVVHSILVAHGGSVEASSVEGSGSVFRLRLPVA